MPYLINFVTIGLNKDFFPTLRKGWGKFPGTNAVLQGHCGTHLKEERGHESHFMVIPPFMQTSTNVIFSFYTHENNRSFLFFL